MLDGKQLLVTNMADHEPQQIVARYRALADIERGFRMLKSDIEIAPAYHRLPDRICAHALICFLALILYRVLRLRLKRGQIAWEAGLDLHGYSLDEARLELEGFLKEAVGSRMRCVLVVHGKAWGSTADYPVIKSHVNAWLREWPTVLAFCSAKESDGGTGAVYVLLRRRGQAF